LLTGTVTQGSANRSTLGYFPTPHPRLKSCLLKSWAQVEGTRRMSCAKESRCLRNHDEVDVVVPDLPGTAGRV
jgi:hypothetical protein